MPDIADRANDLMELDQKIALSHRKKGGLKPIGCCYNCSEPLHKGLFCDADCRDDYERREGSK